MTTQEIQVCHYSTLFILASLTWLNGLVHCLGHEYDVCGLGIKVSDNWTVQSKKLLDLMEIEPDQGMLETVLLYQTNQDSSPVHSLLLLALCYTAMADEIWESMREAYSRWCNTDLEFSCEYCQLRYQSEDLLWQHISQVHRVDFGKYAMDNPHYRVAKHGDFCRVCESSTRSLFQHLDEAHHKMAPEVYFVRFVFHEVSAFVREENKTKDIANNAPINQDLSISQYDYPHNDEEATLDSSSFAYYYDESVPEKQANLEDSIHQNTLSPAYYLPEENNHARDTSTEFERKEARKKGGKRQFTCSVCNYTSNQACNLKRHERIHTGEKPFACHYCDKAFTDEGNKKKHERIHTGEKPFSCSYCDKAFATQSAKKQHERTHATRKQ